MHNLKEEEDSSSDHNEGEVELMNSVEMEFKKLKLKSSKSTHLEIIADAGELKERTSSYEIKINKEIEWLLKNANLEFLVEHFENWPRLNLQGMNEMSDEQLEKILEGKLYIKTIRE
jgi:hypothetical protein